MPCLLLRDRALVKPVKFRNPAYVGDPVNTARIFSQLQVDEIIFLDITATIKGREPQFGLLEEIAAETFMPFSYGGGVRTIEDMKRIFRLGAEKIILNTAAHEDIGLVRRAADIFGSQSVVASMDAQKKMLGGYVVCSHSGTKTTGKEPSNWARELAEAGAGEILVTSIDKDGTFSGYDTELVKRVASAVDVPVVAAGGAARVDDLARAVREGGAAAVAAGAMFVYQGPHRAVLINFPERRELNQLFG